MPNDTRFCYTLLRPTPELIKQLDSIPELTFNIYGYEVGPVSGLLHLQGYLEVAKPVNPWKLKSKLKGFYIEVARESREVNIIYCKKNGVVRVFDPHDYLTTIKI